MLRTMSLLRHWLGLRPVCRLVAASATGPLFAGAGRGRRATPPRPLVRPATSVH